MKALLTAGILALLAMTQAVAQDEAPIILEYTNQAVTCDGIEKTYFPDNYIVVIGNSVNDNEVKIIRGSDGNVLHYLMYGDWEEDEMENGVPVLARMALDKQTGKVVGFILAVDRSAFLVVDMDEGCGCTFRND